MAKPSDFYVGVIDFFSVLLPGALVTLACSGYRINVFGHVFPAYPEGKTNDWVVFLFASYILGHFANVISASFMDSLYDQTYMRLMKWWTKDKLYKQATTLRDDSGASLAGVLKWARGYVNLKEQRASAELDSLEAVSKFFRSFCVVLAGLSIVAARDKGADSELMHTAAKLGFVLAGFSFWRFANVRWKYTQQCYRYFLLLRGQTGSGDKANAQTAS